MKKKLKTIGEKTVGSSKKVTQELSPELYADMMRLIVEQKVIVDLVIQTGGDFSPNVLMHARNARDSYDELIARWRLR